MLADLTPGSSVEVRVLGWGSSGCKAALVCLPVCASI